MAAAAHAIPGLQSLAPEDMDLHSDNDLDFGGDDIELDLDSAPANALQDNDVSIDDAASTARQYAHTVPVDEDDFMADHEDLIGEDDYADVDVTAAEEQPSTSFVAVSAQSQTITPPEEDLLDYSDDEAGPTEADQSGTLEHEPFEVHHTPREAYSVRNDDLQDTTQATEQDSSEEFEQVDTHYPHELHDTGPDEPGQGPHLADGEAYEEEGSVEGQQPYGQDETFSLPEDENSKVFLQEDLGFVLNGGKDDGDNSVASEYHRHSENSPTNNNHDPQSIDLQPITVNYAGNELWLFKQHDLYESGDWLLDDISLAASSMSDLFQACRLSLGDDVSNDHEIGIRFDHLHNLELYEDNTACVAVSLQRLVNLYHTLHTQDGNKEPESFYCSLLFQPRFFTLLSDIAKHAEQESGYSGLHAAVSAGETHFSNVLSSTSTEREQTDWDEEEQEEVDFDTTEPADHERRTTDNNIEYEDQDRQSASAEYGDDKDQQEADEHTYANRSPSNEPCKGHEASDTEDGAQSAQDEAVMSRVYGQRDAEAEARRKQEEEDLLDYDDEGDEDFEQIKEADANEPPASSSTFQGDDTIAGVVEDAPTAEDSDTEFQNDAEDEHINQVDDQPLEGVDEATQSYEDYNKILDRDPSIQQFDADGNTDQGYSVDEHQGTDQQPQEAFLDSVEFDGDIDVAATTNDFVGADNFLDLDNASEWVTEQDGIVETAEDAVSALNEDTGRDKEDDTVNHSAVAASSIADPETASSVDSPSASLQGLKRSIDEAGHGVDNALDSIDVKRPRV